MAKAMTDEEIVREAQKQGIDVNVDQNNVSLVDSENLRAVQARNVAEQLTGFRDYDRKEVSRRLREHGNIYGRPVSDKEINKKNQNFSKELKSDNNASLINDQAKFPGWKQDIGVQNLQTSLANRARNLFQRKKKKTTTSEESKSTENKTSNGDSNSDLSVKEEAKVLRKRMKILKIAAIGLALFSFIFIVLVIAQIVTGGTAIPSAPLASSTNYGTKEFESITDNSSSQHDNEINYYKKLQELEEKYDGEVNINYVNALLMSVYYEADFETNDEELLNETGGLDFVKMTDLAEEFADIIKDCNSTDYSVNGVIFESLKSNSKIYDYYKAVLKNTTLEEVLTNAFDIGEELDKAEIVEDAVLTDETTVTVVETKTEPDSQNNEPAKVKKLTVNEYIADSIYANALSLNNSEAIKAYTIAYSTNLAASNNKLTISSKGATAQNGICSVTLGCSYDVDDNLVSGGGDQSTKNTYFYKGQYYYKKPLESSEITSLNNNINSVFGNVLVNSDGTYPELDIEKINGLGDDYKTILSSSYGNLKLKNIGEDSYILDGSYGTKQVKTSVTFYDQNDYGAYNFCGKKNETIKTSGCGTTSMAIIVSTYENNFKYDPVYMTGEARKTGYCGGGITGTSPGFFKKEANTMKYKFYKASKYSKRDLNLVLQHLSKGDLVIAHMSPGHFTSGGHYMVLGGVDPETKKVYVYDPYNKVNKSYRGTGNGWYSFNDIIVKEAWNFYIVWKG